MKTKIRRIKKLLKLQSHLLSTERLELQTIKDAMEQTQREHHEAVSLLSEPPDCIPSDFLIHRAKASATKIRNCEALLETQREKTLDQARKEKLVKKKLDEEFANLSRLEQAHALQQAIDAYLHSSVEQDQ